jgi:hypothetical protein
MMLQSVRIRPVAVMAALALATGALQAQGVELGDRPTVLSGSAANCTKPATINYERVRDATPEWQEIEGEGVRKGSARYTLLTARMGQRIKAAAKLVAKATGHDLIVVDGDIEDDRGLEVVDVTDQIIDELESVAPNL